MPEDDSGEWHELSAGEPDEEDAAWANALSEEEAPKGPEDELVWQDTFDPRWRNSFEGLAYLGYLDGDVEIPYHSFKVRTLTTGEKIKVVQMIRELEDSIGYPRAYRAAVAAAGLVLVDGKPLLVGKKSLDVISQKYRYVTDNWYDYVIDILYDKINELEGSVLEVLKELGVYKERREVAQVPEAEIASQIEE
jgi:hypothetical protein